jgi:hypothetical protein
MLKLTFSGDGEVLGSTNEWRDRPKKVMATVQPPRKARDRSEKYCATCLRIRVYGVSTCLPCLTRMGTSVAATVLVYPHAVGYRVQVSNLKKIVAEIRKYGVEPPARWCEVADGRTGRPKKKTTPMSRDARAVTGATAVFVRDGRHRLAPDG